MTRLVSRLCSGVRLLANGMLTHSVWHQAMVENLPLINSNDYLWSVICRIIVFVAALVSNQWEICNRRGRFPTKCLKVEIFPSKMTGNPECFIFPSRLNLFSHFPLPRIRRVLKVFFHYKALGKWLGTLVWGVGGSM